jgi:hypothetical protein
MSLTKVTYAMIQGEVVNVLDFGAVGDGVANDTAAIAAALASVLSTGGTVYFPQGTYLTDSINLRAFTNITLVGENDSTPFQYKPTSVIKIRTACAIGVQTSNTGTEVPATAGTGIVIKNLFINANSLATVGVNCQRAVYMYNCAVKNAVQDGILFEGGSYPIELENVVSQQNGRDGLRVKAPLTTIYTIRDCEFGFNTGNGVTIFDGSTCIFENVLCQGNTGNGFYIERQDPAGFTQPIFLERLTFIGCYSEDNTGYGLYVTSYNTTPSTFTGKIVDLTFINCSFNSDVAQQAYIRGTATPTFIGSPYLSDALDPLYNTIQVNNYIIEGSVILKNNRIRFTDTAGATNGVIWRTGTGSPEGVVAGAVGSLFTRTDGGTGTVLYVKETGAATTLGWVAK